LQSVRDSHLLSSRLHRSLYAIIDIDGSGFITYDELLSTIRQTLFKGSRIIPERAIKALWCSLDADLSNSVDKEEAGAFLRLGVAALPKPAPPPVKSFSASNLVGPLGRIGMNRAIDSTPTSQLLKELKATDIALPADAELTALSKKLCVWLGETCQLETHLAVPYRRSDTSWFDLSFTSGVPMECTDSGEHAVLVQSLRHHRHRWVGLHNVR
jgi:hypothetical protein